MRIEAVATLSNLRLAWRRVTTGGNYQYKRFFRHLYYAYELALDDNLRDLRARLIGFAWEPHSPDKIYLPKPSGLQRPLTLLHLEDQIVLQAVANVIAARVATRRNPHVLKSVFSNVLQSRKSIFFLRSWRRTYAAFARTVDTNYRQGHNWVADFDLAAFYETISHDLLLRTAYPRLRESVGVQFLKRCLSVWTSARSANSMAHGLPQGPIASDFLAEVFLLPIDEAMVGVNGYVRYVDDIRLFGQSASETRRAVIKLEIHCRERGLIPQVGKFDVREARSLAEARGMLPSVGAVGDSSDPRLSPSAAERLIRAGVGGKPLRVRDKTRVRYVFYRAKPSARLLRLACVLLPRHPEHIDAFAAFFAQYDYRKAIRDCCLALLAQTPYEYVQGELWHVLARFVRTRRAFDSRVRLKMVRRAIAVVVSSEASTAVKWGAAHFLCAVETEYGGRHSLTLRRQKSALLQAMLGPSLPASAIAADGVVRQYFTSKQIEPALALVEPMNTNRLTPASVGIRTSALSSQVRNVFRAVGLIRVRRAGVDVIGEMIHRRYDVQSAGQWQRLLRGEYVHATGLLAQAEAVFWMGRSQWLSHMNSFNQIVFLALQRHLRTINSPAVVTTHGRNGELVDFGVTLQATNTFSRHHAAIADAFRVLNARRNKLPGSHPYDKKTTGQTRNLGAQERNRFVAMLRLAYVEVVRLCP